MSTAAFEDLRAFWLEKTDDPAILARDDMLLGWLLEHLPERRKQIAEEGKLEGKLEEARNAVRGVLETRGLKLGAEDEARIDACAVLETLERWRNQAVVAASVAEALR